MLSAVRSAGGWLLDAAGYALDCGAALRPERLPGRSQAVAVYFHGVTTGPADGTVDLQERVTPAFVRNFIRAMKLLGYRFGTPDALAEADRPAERLALLTSDDGYASVEALLPILEAEAAPITLFLTTEPAKTGTIYWWDQLVIARRRGAALQARLKHQVRSRSERDDLLRRLGLDPARPAFSDSHRVLAPSDVARLAHHPLIRFGNHTRNHLSLPLLSEAEFLDEVEGAGEDIARWIGRRPEHFAFPYGDHDERCLELLRREGWRTAFTTEAGPISRTGEAAGGLQLVPRYRLSGDRSARWQARILSRGLTFGSGLRQRCGRLFRGGSPNA